MASMGLWLQAFMILKCISSLRTDGQCTRRDYVDCVKMADPLLTDPNLIFPDKMADIDDLCRRWRHFVQCVKAYTDRCFTENEQQEFIKAVESPVDLVHQICTETQYQTEYLQHATCIQSTITRDGHCTQNYRKLVEHVLGEVDRNNLCCSHHDFHECVLAEVRKQCNSNGKGDPATKFTRQILEKSLGFLQAQCYDLKPQECLSYTRSTESHSNMINRTQPIMNQHEPNQQQRSASNAQFQHNSPPQVPDIKEKLPLWTPDQRVNLPHNANVNKTEEDANSHTRHSSYGRGINWTGVNAPPSAQTPTNNNQKPSGYNTWRVLSNVAVPNTYTTEPWYPSIPNNRGKMNSVVDEPNQQGLANNVASNTNELLKPYGILILITMSTILTRLIFNCLWIQAQF